MSELTQEQKATNDETWKHINRVQQLMTLVVSDLQDRLIGHDQSKLKSPEVEVFTEYTPKLKTSTYGSDEYKGFLAGMQVALKNHYKENRHHPEHFPNGIDGMDLLDLVEMMCDWKAAGERHKDSSIMKSIEINTERFGLSPQLVKILKNTCRYLEG